MIKFFKRQWLRFNESCKAFLREWKFNFINTKGHELEDRSFEIMGLIDLNFNNSKTENAFSIKRPYFGLPLLRIDGKNTVLRYRHYNPATGEVRYSKNDKTDDGFIISQIDISDWEL